MSKTKTRSPTSAVGVDGKLVAVADTESPPRSKSSFAATMPERLFTIGLQLGAMFVLLAVWEASVDFGFIDKFWISRPIDVIARLYNEAIIDRTLWRHIWVTTVEALGGLALGAILGVAAGLVLAKFHYLNVALDPLVMGLYGLPRVALAPLFVLWFGIGIDSKIYLSSIVVFFVLLLNTYQGTKSVDPELVAAVRTMGGSPRFVLRRVVVPSVTAFIVSGLRTSVGLAFSGAIVAEMVGSQEGLGFLLMRTRGSFDTTGMFSVLVVLAIEAILLNSLMKRIERRLFAWREDVKL